MDGLAQALSAFLRLYQVTKIGRDGAMVTKDIILNLTDQFLTEISIMFGDDEPCTLTCSQATEVYVLTFFLRQGEEIQNSIDFLELDDLVWNLREDFKPKDAFAILDIHKSCSSTSQDNKLP